MHNFCPCVYMKFARHCWFYTNISILWSKQSLNFNFILSSLNMFHMWIFNTIIIYLFIIISPHEVLLFSLLYNTKVVLLLWKLTSIQIQWEVSRENNTVVTSINQHCSFRHVRQKDIESKLHFLKRQTI